MAQAIFEPNLFPYKYPNILKPSHSSYPVAYRGGVGGLGCSNPPPPEIPKALQNRVKLNPIVKTVKNCWI